MPGQDNLARGRHMTSDQLNKFESPSPDMAPASAKYLETTDSVITYYTHKQIMHISVM